jgi:hypothetical protein
VEKTCSALYRGRNSDRDVMVVVTTSRTPDLTGPAREAHTELCRKTSRPSTAATAAAELGTIRCKSEWKAADEACWQHKQPAMNSERRAGLLISATLHGLVVGILATPATLHRTPSQTDSTVAVLQVNVADLAGVTDQTFDFDLEKIISRSDSLFPFTQGALLPAQMTRQPQTENRAPSTNVFVPQSRLAHPRLELTNDRLQELLDESWSRRNRWDAFEPIAVVASHHHPDVGDLSLLLRGYVDQNSFQPFAASWNPEGKVWALLSIAADHPDFVEYISRFIAHYPSSRSSTELLLLLDKVVQANLEALVALVKSDPLTDLDWTAAVNPRAAKALSTLHQYHQRQLGRRGLWRIDALRMKYDEVRVAVLQHLIRNTPRQYRSNDALFLLGEIYWKQGRFTDAVLSWQTMVPHSGDTHFAASSEVRQAIATGTAHRERINAALERDKDRWLDSSFARLQRFGYRFDTF